MDEQYNEPTSGTRPRRSKWLIAVLSALILAVGIQGAYLYQLHGRLEKAMAATRTQKDDDGWTVIPRPDQDSTQQSGADQQSNSVATLPDPFAQSFNQSLNGNSWDPFKEMQQMREQMNQVMSQAFGHAHTQPSMSSLVSMTPASPDFKMIDEAHQYVIKVDVPESSKNNLKVKLDGQTLTVMNTRSVENQRTKDGHVLLHEKTVGEFVQTINLPQPVDESGMKTSYKNGEYTITLPKLHQTSGQPSESVRMQ